MNRRALLSAFAATAGGLLIPEPVRAYSFVGGWRETEYERAVRLAAESLREYFEQKLGVAPLPPLGRDVAAVLRSITLLPRGRWRVVPGDLLATKTLEMEFVPDEPREYEAVLT